MGSDATRHHQEPAGPRADRSASRTAPRQRFLQALSHSRLLSTRQFQQVEQRVRRAASFDRALGELVRDGLLTKWQVRQLKAGHAQMFLGKYRLLEAIGRGGMGTVFRAEQPGLQRNVALKVMSRSLLQDQTAISRFQREMLAVGCLNHPNFVVAYDADSVGDVHFLVMECLNGRSLKEWIRESGPLPVDWACEVIRQAATGLQYASGLGLVHRDIKPSNLLIIGASIRESPVVKILDMGLARFAHQPCLEDLAGADRVGDRPQHDPTITQTGQIMGSPLYVAPEQAVNSSAADIRADIYGLGVTLYELLTGQPPFRFDNFLDTIRAKLIYDAPPCRGLRPELPAELEQVLVRMLARDPRLRLQTPGEVAELLEPFAASARSASDSLPVACAGSFGTGPAERSNDHIATYPVDDSEPSTASTAETLSGFIAGIADSPSECRSITGRTRTRRGPLVTHWHWLSGVMAVLIAGTAVWWGAFSGDAAVSDEPFPGAEPSGSDADRQRSSLRQPGLDDEVAGWALNRGARVQIEVSGTVVELAPGADLPQAPFVIVELDLEGVQNLGDEDIARLARLTGLRSLVLKSTRVQDDQLQALSTCPQLVRLNLAFARELTDRGAGFIGRMTELEELDLSFTRCGDAGVSSLTQLHRLRVLNLSLTNVSDESLPILKSWKQLRFIDLRDSRMSAAALGQLRAALPECRLAE